MGKRDRPGKGADDAATERKHADERGGIDAEARLDRLQRRMRSLQKSVRELQESLAPLVRAHNLRELDQGRAMQQLAALEERVGRIEERLEGDRYDTDDASLTEARNLVDTVRREHDQVRVRMQIVSSYEERLRRLEATMVELYDGDPRHPV